MEKIASFTVNHLDLKTGIKFRGKTGWTNNAYQPLI